MVFSLRGVCRFIIYLLAACLNPALAGACLPGTSACSPQLQSELQQARKNRGEDYLPGTRHKDRDGRPLFTNRLILEDSPYLLQHAHNPVDWHAWGTEAFRRAETENKPVFLSIGYSTCHWCHVMKRESFEDIGIARYLNEHFIPVKVDRERRPDVDEIYMTALLLTKGQGGWPLSSFLTQDGKPFYSGSYYPPEEFLELLRQLNGLWEAEQDELKMLAAELADTVKDYMQTRGAVAAIGPELVQAAVSGILNGYNERWGEFGGGPRFTHEASMLLLLQHGYRNMDAEIIGAAERALTRIAHGGLYDHVAGGFHRYSTDPYWLAPHFEKMLYHQANMAGVYLAAYRYTGNRIFARIAEQTLDHILRDMRSPEGGFYSAVDAESDGEEGRYYVWTLDEIRHSLPGEDAVLAQSVFGVTEQGNFNGRNILYMPEELSAVAQALDINERELTSRLDGIREKLRLERMKRAHPLVDKKVLVAWNGMAISALAGSARVLGRREFLDAAIRAADFLWEYQRMNDGALLRIRYDGRSSSKATQDDYAYFAEGLIALYDATGEQSWLTKAVEITGTMISRFWDPDAGGFYMSEDGDTLFVTPKQFRDGDIPSGNSAALHVLVSLSNRVMDWEYKNLAVRLIRSFSGAMDKDPASSPYFMVAVDESLNRAAGPSEYAARGNIRLTAQDIGTDIGDNHEIRLSLAISPGWHVNSYNAGHENLIPLDINLAGNRGQWGLTRVRYPEPRFKKLSFAGEELALYEDSIDIFLTLSSPPDQQDFSDKRVDITIRLQACDDEVCLPPEDVVLEYLHTGNR